MRSGSLARLATVTVAAGLLLGLERNEQGVARLVVARSLPAERPASPPPLPACSPEMVLVEGAYCPEVRQECLERESRPGSLPRPRCVAFAEPAECASERISMRFCIDRVEHSAQGADLPESRRSLVDAVEACSAAGKRVCREDEWTFACEGEQMQPFPYGFVLDETACATGRTDLTDRHGKLADHRRPRGNLASCASPFGVLDLAGNLEEHVIRGEEPGDINALPVRRSILKGAYWQPGDHRCRAGQVAHDQHYAGVETGFRCCKDAD